MKDIKMMATKEAEEIMTPNCVDCEENIMLARKHKMDVIMRTDEYHVIGLVRAHNKKAN